METKPLESIIETAVLAADGKGATDQVALDVAEHFGYADAFLIVSGSVERNVQAISDGIEEDLNKAGVRTIRREGRAGGRWILLDFGDLLVHVFHHEDREFYQLERLWGDCPNIEVNDTLERARLAHQASLDVE
ncbi:ribosome silencing factor [Leucobacter sp. 1207-22]|uniref:ribosome silencing factor n=1 Tax=Leucobacter sp. 1207-22 TaxID=2604456 RepID=UPI004062B6B9